MISKSVLIFFLALTAVYSEESEERGIGTNPGPAVAFTRGEPWPKPQQYTKSEGIFVIRPSLFKFEVSDVTCDILDEAIVRYSRVVLNHHAAGYVSQQNNVGDLLSDPDFVGYLDTVQVQLTEQCESFPHANMDENYELHVNGENSQGTAIISSKSIWGILRGLETFTQLLTFDESGTFLTINTTSIVDFPRFSFRGLMVDTSRHYQPVHALLSILEGMEANKLNVFHWHIVDDHSFPYQSKVFPDLSHKGAFSPYRHIYTHEDIKNIIEFARLRGIRVIPEFDTPGHTRSWGQAYPQYLTACYQNNEPDGSYGPMDPTKDELYTFVGELFKEVHELFPDTHFHLGGDEVPFNCWESNPTVKEFMTQHNLTGKGLEDYYIQKVVNIVAELNAVSLVWQEVFDDGVQLASDVLVHVWKGGHQSELAQVTQAGYNAVLSSCWYLDHLSTGGDWQKYYECEPYDFSGTDEQKHKIVGGEACMWSEVVDVINLSSRVWPRASAAAERFWSSQETNNKNEAARRIEEHVCRMNRRGIHAQPANGGGYCPDSNY